MAAGFESLGHSAQPLYPTRSPGPLGKIAVPLSLGVFGLSTVEGLPDGVNGSSGRDIPDELVHGTPVFAK